MPADRGPSPGRARASVLTAAALRSIEELLAGPDADTARRYPGDGGGRQPVHTVYVPGHHVRAELPQQWGTAARESLDAAGGVEHLLDVHGRVEGTAERERVGALVLAKLADEPIEDLRIDFEDGYGVRGDDEEDTDVVAAAREVTRAVRGGLLPPFVGIRHKSLEPATRGRGLRTLGLFLSTLAEGGDIPDGLLLTLPKVTTVAQVRALVLACEDLERTLGLAEGSLRFELQVETPQAILGPDGSAPVAPMLHAGGGRVGGLHFGTYDYSASLGIAAAHQSMDHPAADHAKAVMQLAAAGTGVRLSDGSTNILPIGSAAAVDSAWAVHGRLIRRSLERGFYQGWDLHPAQLPSRYAATYAFFRESLPQARARLSAYVGHVPGGVLDEPATARALAAFLLRGLDCGAVSGAELPDGVTRAVLERLARSGGGGGPQ